MLSAAKLKPLPKLEPQHVDSDSDDDAKRAAAKAKYPPKSQEEILAALEEIAKKEEEGLMGASIEDLRKMVEGL